MSWARVELQELARQEKGSIVSGPFGSNISAKYFVDDGVPVIRGNNLTKGAEKFLDEGFAFLTETKAAEFRNCIAIKDDIVFTAAGSIGQVGMIPPETRYERYVISNKQLRVRLDHSKVDPRFVYSWLSSPQMVRYLENMNNGGAVPLLNLGIIRRVPVPFPPLATQKRIADILSTYDDLIENNRRRMALLEEAARQLYREWFVRLRFPGHEHTRIVDGVPEGWDRVQISDICSFLGRGISPRYDDEGEYVVINQKCIRNRLLSLEPARKQSKEFKPERALQLHDVLINSTGTGTLGRVAQCWITPEMITADSHVTIARPTPEASPLWFGYAAMELQPQFESMGEGATNQQELSKARIGAVEVLLPESSHRTQFSNFASRVASQVMQLNAQNSRLQTARDLLLPRLMSGEIAV